MSFFDAASSSTRALDATLELAEPLLAGHQIGAAGFEHGPALPFQPAAEQPQERGLADAQVAAHQQRARLRRRARWIRFRRAHRPSTSGSTSTSSAAACQKRPNEVRNARSMFISRAVSSTARSSLAKRMADAGKNGPDDLPRLRADAVDTRAERGRVAEARPFLEVLAKSRDHEHVVPPPLARRQKRAAGGRPRIGDRCRR